MRSGEALGSGGKLGQLGKEVLSGIRGCEMGFRVRGFWPCLGNRLRVLRREWVWGRGSLQRAGCSRWQGGLPCSSCWAFGGNSLNLG